METNSEPFWILFYFAMVNRIIINPLVVDKVVLKILLCEKKNQTLSFILQMILARFVPEWFWAWMVPRIKYCQKSL